MDASTLVRNDQQIHIVLITICIVIFRVHINILFIFKVKSVLLI